MKGIGPVATEAALDVDRVQRPASVLRREPAGREGKRRPGHPEHVERVPAWHERVKALEGDVLRHGAKVMSGSTLNVAEFERLGPAIVREGLVTQSDVDYVLNGIKNGFDLGVDESRLQGKRVHRNYKSAYEKKDLDGDGRA